MAIKAHTQSGELILCDRLAHIYRSEFGSHALLSGVTSEGIDGERGRYVRVELGRFTTVGTPQRGVPWRFRYITDHVVKL